MKGTLSEGGIATLRVARAVDYPVNLAPAQSSGTHQTWLHGDVERAPFEVLPSESLRGGRESLHLGVGRHITEPLGEIVAAAYHPVIDHHYGSYRHLAVSCGLPGLLKGKPHVIFVGHSNAT